MGRRTGRDKIYGDGVSVEKRYQDGDGLIEGVADWIGIGRWYDYWIPSSVSKYDGKASDAILGDGDVGSEFFGGYFGAYLTDEMLIWLAFGLGGIVLTSLVIVLLKYML